MSQPKYPFQPGAILHDAIVGTFRAGGGSFENWCRDNGIAPSVARNATFGQSRGPKGRALLARIIAAAGPEFLHMAYSKRIAEYAEEVKKGAA
jgi:hypothetical protein